jgi:16S rRNA (uracil1498-N3)-methyltransferase
MHRLLTDTESLALENPVLSKEAARHLKVLRPQPGERIELFDGRGSWRTYAFGTGALSAVSPVMTAAAPTPRLTLFACVTKGSRWDWTVEKATELGVGRVVPVISERTIVRIPAAERETKRERWSRIAADAARQCDSKWLPEVSAPVDFDCSLELARSCRCFAGALVSPSPRPLAEALAESMKVGFADDWGVFVGPEGDFTSDELSALLQVAEPTSFGATILRAETAAIFALSVLKGALDAANANS